MNDSSLKKILINPFRLLNSVPFGILLMALTAAFIAAGSARPWFKEMGVDEWPGLRNWFDKTDMQFFNAWPLKTLMALLVINLMVVTWRRIPLTPPRYGVWCIHAGIITLICGTSLYYSKKVEGRIRIFKDSRVGPTVVDHFYDKDQRSLYVRYAKDGRQEIAEIPLPTLPRFKEYDNKYGNIGALLSRRLTDINAATEVTDPLTGKLRSENLADSVGMHDQQMKLDVIGFYPYAGVQTDFVADPASTTSGVDLTLQRIEDQQPLEQWTLVGSDPQHNTDFEHVPMDLHHVDATPEMVDALVKAAGELFHLDVSLPDQPAIALNVQVGKTYTVGTTGYRLQIQRFDPNFPTFETGEPVTMLTLIVTSPTQSFRRSIIQGRPDQTDFKLTARMREQKPIDPNLNIKFQVNDPFHLLPQQNQIKHTLLTPPGSTELVDITTGFGTVASEVHRSPDGSEDIEIKPDTGAMEAPFAGPMSTPASQPSGDSIPPTADANRPMVALHLQRRDHLKAVDSILVVPPGRRDKNSEDEGNNQVAKIKVTMGDWSAIVFAPFADEAGDRLLPDQWRGGMVTPPGMREPLQFQLGFTRRPLPVHLALDQFNLIPYPGAPADAPNPMYLDFISTITLTDPNTGDSYTDKAQMNHPIYYNGGDWLFFQATYDSSPDHAWTGLGIGNRPARGIMWAGFIMIMIGLAYAFYLKPVIVRQMKENAIARAKVQGKMARNELLNV